MKSAFTLLAALLVGCASTGPVAQRSGVMGQVLAVTSPTAVEAGEEVAVPEPLLPYIHRDAMEGQRNRVLNAVTAGTVAWQIGAVRQSQALFADAWEQIETIYADNPQAKQARSTFKPEDVKDFKGEPYERTMVGYYRGLAEMALGDWDNARASFRWGEFQDTLSASEEYQSDMGLLMFLRGWTQHCTGQLRAAQEDFQQAREVQDALPLPDATHNLLMLVESGNAPVKYTTGQYDHELRFRPGNDVGADQMVMRVADQDMNAALAEDLYWQAATRGGRPVDAILAGKASFKQGAETAAGVAAVTSAVALQTSMLQSARGDYNAAYASSMVSLGSSLLGLAAKIAEKAANPKADSRSWYSLPGRVHLATAVHDETMIAAAPVVLATRETGAQIRLRVTRIGGCWLAWGREGRFAPEWNEHDASAWRTLSGQSVAALMPVAASDGLSADGWVGETREQAIPETAIPETAPESNPQLSEPEWTATPATPAPDQSIAVTHSEPAPQLQQTPRAASAARKPVEPIQRDIPQPATPSRTRRAVISTF